MSSIPPSAGENQLLQSALDYARRDWRVFPVHTILDGQCSCGGRPDCTPGKHPMTPHGLKDATTDQPTITRWWENVPHANVGIRTGPESGLFVIGPDGQAGCEALAELARPHGPLPTTPRARSGSQEGLHYYFRWPAGGGIRTGANFNGLPIDVRGKGGLVVAPPSLHKSGGRYAWEVSPDEAELADCPEWLLHWLRSGKGTNAVTR